MNRLAPLIVRSRSARLAPLARALAMPVEPEAGPWIGEDVKLFLTGWIGGLIFFGTLLA